MNKNALIKYISGRVQIVPQKKLPGNKLTFKKEASLRGSILHKNKKGYVYYSKAKKIKETIQQTKGEENDQIQQ